jgi:hypothetical protein
MHRFDISEYSQLSDLPLHRFDEVKFSVYVIDRQWNYLFVNNFVKENLGKTNDELLGKNMWKTFGALPRDPSFISLKNNSEKGLDTQLVTTSPINSQRLNIVGRPLQDCYIFFASILPNKEDLLAELRNELKKKS